MNPGDRCRLFSRIRDSVLGKHEKLVLFALASRLNDQTEDAYPGHKRLREDTGLSDGTCREAVYRLRELGIVSVDEGGGRRSNRYRLIEERLPQRPTGKRKRGVVDAPTMAKGDTLSTGDTLSAGATANRSGDPPEHLPKEHPCRPATPSLSAGDRAPCQPAPCTLSTGDNKRIQGTSPENESKETTPESAPDPSSKDEEHARQTRYRQESAKEVLDWLCSDKLTDEQRRAFVRRNESVLAALREYGPRDQVDELLRTLGLAEVADASPKGDEVPPPRESAARLKLVGGWR